MSRTKLIIWRCLVIVGIGLLILSWLLPWWAAFIPMVSTISDAMIIHPYGLEINVHPDDLSYMGINNANEMMPSWFTPIMWAYLGLCIIASLFGIFLGDKRFKKGPVDLKWSSLLIGIVGLSYVVAAIAAVVVAVIKTGDFELAFLGTTYFDLPGWEGYQADVHTGFRIGYWLAVFAGFFFIALSFVRSKITVNKN